MLSLWNSQNGDLNEFDGYNCAKCLNRGFFWEIEEKPPYNEYTIECSCVKVRANIRRMKRSGLEPLMKRSTFDRFQVTEKWQRTLKENAQKFPKEVDGLDCKWWFVGGGIGAGKTHLCTAIAREFLLKGQTVRYMLWVEDSKALKANVNAAEHEECLGQFQKAEVLYIDDFWKPMMNEYGNAEPTKADIRLAYELLDYRYRHRNLITIISSERYIDEIERIDSAIGSRIYEMSKHNRYNLTKNSNRNFRMKDRGQTDE